VTVGTAGDADCPWIARGTNALEISNAAAITKAERQTSFRRIPRIPVNDGGNLALYPDVVILPCAPLVEKLMHRSYTNPARYRPTLEGAGRSRRVKDRTARNIPDR
jgi:hypothetical protein